MVVPKNTNVKLGNKAIDIIFICRPCIDKNYNGKRRPPDTEPIIISRGKCPWCEKGDMDSNNPTLWAFRNTGDFTDEQQVEIKNEVYKILEDKNE